MPVRNPKQLGTALRRERKRQGLTQAQLAEKAGLRQQTISAVEGGKLRSQLYVVFDILSALELDFHLASRAANPPPDFQDLF